MEDYILAGLVALVEVFGFVLLMLIQLTRKATPKPPGCTHDLLKCAKCGLEFHPVKPRKAG